MMATPKKRKLVGTDYNLCVICQKSSSEILHNLTEKGLPALAYAVNNRVDDVSERLKDAVSNGVESFLSILPKYHPRCRSLYTNKKSVSQKSKSSHEVVTLDHTNSMETGESSGISLRSASPKNAIDHKEDCFICGRERTGKGDRKLLLVTTFDRQNLIWKKAKELGDDEMLTHIQGYGDSCIDMIANGFRYHKPCLNKYLKMSDLRAKDVSDGTVDHGLQWLVTYIESSLTNDPEAIIFLNSLRDMYNNWLSQQHHLAKSHVPVRSSVLRKKIEKYYSVRDYKVMVVPRNGQSSIICRSDMSVGSLMTKIAKLQKQITGEENAEESEESLPETAETSNKTNILLFKAARTLKDHIKQHASKWRTERISKDESVTITYEAAASCIPTTLYNFVAWMITDAQPSVDGSDSRVQLDSQEKSKVLNLSQDISASITYIPTPKHIGIALHILKQTRSKDLVTLLNRFGNCISYHDAQRYIATIAQETIANKDESEPVVPSNLQAGLFTQCAIDNLDFHEETPDGTTMHGTTHIFYQYKDVATDMLKEAAAVPMSKKSRKISYAVTQTVQSSDSGLTLKDRQKSRSLCGMQLTYEPQSSQLLRDLTVLWQLAQSDMVHTDTQQNLVTWNDFHKLITHNEKSATLIGYGPFIPKSPTNPDVVDASLKYCIAVTNKLGQRYCVITCDQAIYEIALGLQNKSPVAYNTLVLRMGGFHIANNFLGVIGSLFKSSGIEIIMAESGVINEGTMKKIMSGKNYYAMLRCHSLMFASMFELFWEAFESWALQESNTDLQIMASFSEVIQRLADSIGNQDGGSVMEARNNVLELEQDVNLLLNNFKEMLEDCPTAKLWLMYIDMVLILKRYIEAERSSNWDQHLVEVENMLPYMVAAGHTKYTSCIPHYLKAMKNLPSDVAAEFQQGNFSVRVIDGKFNAVWTDMALEQTYNREAKTQLFKGITQQEAARDKYIQALPVLTAVSESTKGMVHLQEAVSQSAKPHSHVREKQCVNEIKAFVKCMINPFTYSSPHLLNIATGEKCKQLELINAKEMGLAALSKAEQNEAVKVQPVKICTFEEKKVRKSGKHVQVNIYRDETSVLRSLCFLGDVNKDAFSYEWTEYPTSLFEPNRDTVLGYVMRKGNKAEYINALKKGLGEKWVEEDTLPTKIDETALFVDAMSFINRHQNFGCNTFHDIQSKYLKKLLSVYPYTCVNIVGDRYDVDASKSLKADERSRRHTKKSGRTIEIGDKLPVPSWKPFIENPQNKMNIQNYLADTWIANYMDLPANVRLILGGISKERNKAVNITRKGFVIVSELACEDHEEADTRIFAHVAYCVHQYGYKCAVVQATDTDIIIMGIYYSVRILGLKELWVQKGAVYIPCHIVARTLATQYNTSVLDITSSLLCGHFMSGCDTVSYIFGKGKNKAFSVAMENSFEMKSMNGFGDDSLIVTSEVINSCRLFILKLYGYSTGTLDELRAHNFGRLKGDLRKLPPSESAFENHMLRGLYQIAIAKRAHQCNLNMPDATLFGRVLFKGILVPILMNKPPKPPTSTATHYCQCRKSKCKKKLFL